VLELLGCIRNVQKGFAKDFIFGPLNEPSVKFGAIRLLHEELPDTMVNFFPFSMKPGTLPCTVKNTVFAWAPWALLACKPATGKLFIPRIKGAVHGNS